MKKRIKEVLLNSKTGSDLCKRCLGMRFKSGSKPIHKKDLFLRILWINFDNFIYPSFNLSALSATFNSSINLLISPLTISVRAYKVNPIL